MACKRNRILALVDYLESCGIVVNINKNKARGNRGFFRASSKEFRIDIAKGQEDDAVLTALAHEFAHFVHYNYDKTLNSLDFIFDNTEEIQEELLSVTVLMIPKRSVKPLFDLKESLNKEVADLSSKLENFSVDFKRIEENIKKTPLKHLLKYDKVKVFEGFGFKYYSIDSLNNNSEIDMYLKLKSKKRALNRVNSRISRLNNYYNNPTELFARAFELYVEDADCLSKNAPKIFLSIQDSIELNRVPLLANFVKILKNIS